mmetsp:Transcript_14115/g.43542  ORF Transcript_14115/g.43542 Transcript_14115/m.43542 type:complete len:85 (+) Transcript_14115:243-497(+)
MQGGAEGQPAQTVRAAGAARLPPCGGERLTPGVTDLGAGVGDVRREVGQWPEGECVSSPARNGDWPLAWASLPIGCPKTVRVPG